MAVTRVVLERLFARLAELEAQKKALSEDAKVALENFIDANAGDGANLKSFKKATQKAYKNWKELQKDRAEFIIVEAETDNMTEAMLSDTTTQEG